MNKSRTSQFISSIERLVRPTDVIGIAFFSSFNKLLPIKLQKKLMANAAKEVPHMGFVVEPYSFFLCHKITDLEAAKQLLPEGYEMIKTKIFSDDEPQYYIIFGCVTAHTSAFWGSRIEMYVIAKNIASGLLTWVIVDYDTNTNSYDPTHGLVNANSVDSVMTTDFNGMYYVDMRRDDGSRRLAAEADTTSGVITQLDQRLWLEGNLSVDYGKQFNDSVAPPFGLTFDPDEVRQALSIPVDNVHVEENSWHTGLYEAVPSQVACFPYAQHFITDSFVKASPVTDRDSLQNAVDELGDMSTLKSFSAKPLKRQMALGLLASAIYSTSLLVFIILHFTLKH